MVWDLANDRRLFQVLRRYLVKLEKSKMLALREYDSEAPGRPGYFLDAKLVWMSAPVVAVAAAAVLIGGHLLSRRRGLDFLPSSSLEHSCLPS